MTTYTVTLDNGNTHRVECDYVNISGDNAVCTLDGGLVGAFNGFMSVVADEEPEKDMNDPANWQVGDTLVAVNDGLDIKKGDKYRLLSDASLYFRDRAGDKRALGINSYRLRFHHRP